MIRGLENLKCGQYIGDFRYDEGFRIREDNVCPCLSSHAGGGGIEYADDFDNRGFR